IIRNRISHIGKDEIIKIDNHRKMDVYADQIITTGGHHTHEVGGKAELKAGQKIKQRTKLYKVSGSDKVTLLGPSGTITIDSGGITLKGNVKIKGSLAITSGQAGMVEALQLRANVGQPLCIPCLLANLGHRQ
ncbi:type VI secretion system tip protein VgrG, partial [Candidatus Gracilibacteria bacterium]|nr:type VI secretion system tip protein VgrG [Candidatus Gracilibacteria bacterium]